MLTDTENLFLSTIKTLSHNGELRCKYADINKHTHHTRRNAQRVLRRLERKNAIELEVHHGWQGGLEIRVKA